MREVLLIAALWLMPPHAYAHSLIPAQIDVATGFSAAVLMTLWLGYTLGARRISAPRRRWYVFHLAATITLLTLFGPLDEWAESNTAVHMAQHMLMMVVIAPLWVLSRPLPQWAALWPRGARVVSTPLLRCARHPMLAASIHGLVIWAWHMPKLYVLALENTWWHTIEHLCFILSAGAFWWSVLYSSLRTTPRALLALLFTLMHTGFLGALLTFAETSLYGPHRPLSHQQLAGLLMWVMGGFPYFGAALWIGWRWFSRSLRGAAPAAAK